MQILNRSFYSRVRSYDNFITELPDLVKSAITVLIPSQFVYTGGSSYAVYNAVSLELVILRFTLYEHCTHLDRFRRGKDY